MKVIHIFLVALLLAVLLVAVSCGSPQESTFPPLEDGSAESGGDENFIPPPFGDAHPCLNLECKQVGCEAGGKTTLSGTVFDPAGKVPLYNAVVYVPNAPVAPITTGASCDRCGTLSGSPLVVGLTDAAGHFSLENIPVGSDIPLVVQIGKWRRQVVISSVVACTDNVLTDHELTRLPRNQSEGDLPQMALASGNADPFECLLTKMGIDTAEFTANTGSGRVHYYHQNGVDTLPPAPSAGLLFDDLSQMKTYDIVFLPCEGGPNLKTILQDQNLVSYTDVGGRVFTTHYGYVWLFNGAAPFPSSGNWLPEQSDLYSSVLPVFINTSFPKGAAFAQWLVNVGATPTLGAMEIREGRHDLNSATPPSTPWMTTVAEPVPNTDATLHMTFNTPLAVQEELQCGRVVYSDFHVSASALSGSPNFPASCKSGDLSPQELALEFMVFDLSSCLQGDTTPPAPPVH